MLVYDHCHYTAYMSMQAQQPDDPSTAALGRQLGSRCAGKLHSCKPTVDKGRKGYASPVLHAASMLLLLHTHYSTVHRSHCIRYASSKNRHHLHS